MRLVAEARTAGARLNKICEVLGLDTRTLERWRHDEVGDDMRKGPTTSPSNKLSEAERQHVIDVCTSPAYRDLSPKQIVPKLADDGQYIASESTLYRVLHEHKLDAHRGRARAASHARPKEHAATSPCQVWSWDITYLKARVQGSFYFLYMFVDVFSRKIVGWEVFDKEDSHYASQVLAISLLDESIDGESLVLHQDNGSPMKGATFKATMEKLGVIPSYSRPRVSDDNPYSEALFRTLKYVPSYPEKRFESLEQARDWVKGFVQWYNYEHLHSAIGFVTPSSRHDGLDEKILAHRRTVYNQAREQHPERWSKQPRRWERPDKVVLNPAQVVADNKIKKVAA